MTNKVIVFLGDKPSKANKAKDIPFVGTKSYKTLLAWIYKMDINISKVVLANQNGLEAVWLPETKDHALYYNELPLGLSENVVFVALGVAAHRKLEAMELHHFTLPHPSSLNRKLNNKRYISKELAACQMFLNKQT